MTFSQYITHSVYICTYAGESSQRYGLQMLQNKIL